ncbi:MULTISPECIES: hypothetical protein [unclassified Mycobacterium]|uniref:hypothetical protein n=1 Tax=unclassified Mycobacterium TaxID=2642494 RepID=UPI00096C75C1|nr:MULTISPECIES: hypothetical protein [unclassified Mycobacterium]OMC17727.1 hypothetical protein A5736_15610 [Mycobacterium sp. SP-6446]OMC53343.1 hypothetical protein A5747_19870 [Mycobacterium sp. IS-836]
MHTLTRLGACAATLGVVITPAATFAMVKAAAESGTTVALNADLRRCDFSLVANGPPVQFPRLGSGTVLVQRSGSTVTAEVHLADSPRPGTHFDVGLIQEPRPSSAGCGPGDPGTAFTGMDTDGAGNATVTIQDAIRQGTTSVWVVVERGDPHSQNPAEFYTSEYLVPV